LLRTLNIPDVVHIGYPKAASTFVYQYLKMHLEVTAVRNDLTDSLLLPQPRKFALSAKPNPAKIHVTTDEGIAESVCVISNPSNWHRFKFQPDAWDCVKDDIVVDPTQKALRLSKVAPQAKILIFIRDQVSWLESVYRYVISDLPANRRSFTDFCATPTGVVLLRAGHFDKTIRAYANVFGETRVCVLRVEDIVAKPKLVAKNLCNFIGISVRALPRKRKNTTHAQVAKMQRSFPIIESLPTNAQRAMKFAVRMLPGGRASILSFADSERLQTMYSQSNIRTTRLLAEFSEMDRPRTHKSVAV
jgi:hypothetical protein